METAIPVAGDKLVLPNMPVWRKLAKDGMIIGRNPYDSKKLKFIPPDKIEFSDELTKMQAFQYTLTGYVKENEKISAEFFKGMLTGH